MTVIDIVSADTVEENDTIRYTGRRGTITLDVKFPPEDAGDKIRIRGYSHETGENVTVTFRPDQMVDILGS